MKVRQCMLAGTTQSRSHTCLHMLSMAMRTRGLKRSSICFLQEKKKSFYTHQIAKKIQASQCSLEKEGEREREGKRKKVTHLDDAMIF